MAPLRASLHAVVASIEGVVTTAWLPVAAGCVCTWLAVAAGCVLLSLQAKSNIRL
jgi:hypothetical protein